MPTTPAPESGYALAQIDARIDALLADARRAFARPARRRRSAPVPVPAAEYARRYAAEVRSQVEQAEAWAALVPGAAAGGGELRGGTLAALRPGGASPAWLAYQGTHGPLRAIQADGTSRPWSISELDV